MAEVTDGVGHCYVGVAIWLLRGDEWEWEAGGDIRIFLRLEYIPCIV